MAGIEETLEQFQRCSNNAARLLFSFAATQHSQRLRLCPGQTSRSSGLAVRMIHAGGIPFSSLATSTVELLSLDLPAWHDCIAPILQSICGSRLDSSRASGCRFLSCERW
jgi:hypothetical protein